jgi:hypothetical protein
MLPERAICFGVKRASITFMPARGLATRTVRHPSGWVLSAIMARRLVLPSTTLPRIKQIMKGTGIDMKSASHFDQLRGIYWEVTEGPYKAVWPAFVATNSMVEAIAVLVRRFEQSGSQERDIRRRTNLGNYWANEFAGLA